MTPDKPVESRTVRRWGIEWHSHNRLDGTRRFIMWNGGNPLLFGTRKKAREYIRDRYGYIARRADLRAEPHGWKVPQAVRVTVEIARAEK